jgi:alkylation response protein AidB-like acyl-CoA dehydrogenase
MRHDLEANGEAMEDVEAFRERARVWLKANMPPIHDRLGGVDKAPMAAMSDEEELALLTSDRELQGRLFDGGFAGITVPREYGGQGLSIGHHRAFCEELAGYDYPALLQVPNFTPCMSIILEFGTHEQKLRHIPPILKGEHLWVQYLSEPSSGSDAAGAQTTAVRDGDEWVLNGSKIWSTLAWRCDWALCLARTNSDVPKHRGLTVFMLPTQAPGIEIHRIEMLNGNREFCQEFLTDVRVPDTERLGDVDEGWTVGVRWMYHERSFSISPHVLQVAGATGSRVSEGADVLVRLARQSGRLEDPRVRDMIGRARADALVTRAVGDRIVQAMRTGYLNHHGAALSRLQWGVTRTQRSTFAFEIAGIAAVAWDEEDEILGDEGIDYLGKQQYEIGAGTTEMARNVISERVLGMPRERDDSRDIPFKDVAKGPRRT